jgi:hypothetical protein
MNNYEKEITELKKKIAEYEAVEQYIMKTIRNGGEYDDILKAHYREGKVVDGEWVDDKEEEEDESEEEEEEDEKPKPKQIRKEGEDYIGRFCGDMYGCDDGCCKRCYRCNPLHYWLTARDPPRPDMVKDLLKEKEDE